MAENIQNNKFLRQILANSDFPVELTAFLVQEQSF